MIIYIGCFILGTSLTANLFLIYMLSDKQDEIEDIHEEYIQEITDIQERHAIDIQQLAEAFRNGDDVEIRVREVN